MKKIAQRMVSLLLALVFLPALLPAELAGLLSVTTVYAAEPITIASAEDWNNFARSEDNGASVVLTADIALSGTIPVKSYFSGSFDGQGHTITIAGGSRFDVTDTSSSGSGLFQTLEGYGAAVKNLVVQLEGTVDATALTSVKLSSGNETNLNQIHCGVIAGNLMSGAQISRVAVVAGSNGGTFRAVINRWQTQDGNVGGLCGISRGGSVDQCFVGVNVEGWRQIGTNQPILRTGGLMGFAADARITNCMVSSNQVTNLHSNPDLLENQAGQAAGLVADVNTNTLMASCAMDGVKIYSRDIAESSPAEDSTLDRFALNNVNRGTTGYAYAKNTNATVLNCFAYNGTEMAYGGLTVTDDVTSGQSAASAAQQTLLNGSEGVWITNDDDWLALSWMYQTPELAVTQTQDNRDATVTVSQKAPVFARDDSTTWEYTLQASLQGQYGTPAAPEGSKGSAATVTGVSIQESRAAGDIAPGTEAYYSGGSYQFFATVTGQNLTAENTPVTWELVDVPQAEGTPVATLSNTGLLTLTNPLFFGKLTIKATAGGQSDTKELTILPARLTILAPDTLTTVAQGQAVDFGIKTEGYFEDGTSSYQIDWSVTGGKTGTAIDSNGKLTVAADEVVGTKLTIQATPHLDEGTDEDKALLPVATYAVTVNANTASEVSKSVTLQSTAQTVSVSLQTGQRLKVTVSNESATPSAPPAGYTGVTPTSGTITWEMTATPETALSATGSQTGTTRTYRADGAGVATITGSRDFVYTKTESGDSGGEPTQTSETVTWAFRLDVTITDPTVPTAADQTVQMTAVAGSKNTPAYESTTVSEYRLVFPEGEVGSRYQLTVKTGDTDPTPDSAWTDLESGATTVLLTAEQITALQKGTLYLWQQHGGDDAMAASSVTGYQLQESGDTLTLTPLEDYPAVAEKEGKSNVSVTGQWTVTNGQVEGGSTYSVLDLLAKGNPELAGYTSLGPGEVRITVKQTGGNYQNRGTALTLTQTAALSVGNAALKPTIQPRSTGQLTDNSFTIEVPDQPNIQVYYQIYPNVSYVPASEYPTPTTGIKYVSGTSIPYPSNGEKMITVVAVTYPTTSGALPSEADVVTFTQSNLITPDPPELRIGAQEEPFVGSTLYVEGEIFKFAFNSVSMSGSGQPCQVYYTINGNDPVPGSEGMLYDSENPPTLQFNISYDLVIKAVVYDPTYGVSSSVASYTVQRRRTAEKPVASIPSGTEVRPGQSLTLELSEDFVAELPDKGNFVSVEYATYTADSPVFAQYADYTRSESDTPIEGMRYLLVNTGTSVSTAELPIMRYLMDDAESSLRDSGVTYQYAVCQVWSAMNSENQLQYYIRFTNPSELRLEGASGDQHTLRVAAFAPSGVTSYLDSEEATFTYKIRGTVAAPQAVPQTDTQGGTVVDIGERIALTSGANTEIYYTTNGTQPEVVWVEPATPESAAGHWEPANESTQKYTENLSVPNTSSKLFILNAIAVSVDDSLENSPLATFVYTVNPLEKAATPAANPTTDASNPTRLANGERITLTTTTLNTDIYYTTDGSVPSYDDRDAWDAGYAAAAAGEKGQDADGTRWYNDADGVQQKEPATRIYDVQQGITMTATDSQQFFTVTALAVDKDRQTPQTSASDAVSFVYRLAQVAAPTSSPATSAEEVAVIEPGTTVVLTSNTVGAKIYYTKDTTQPDLTDLEAVDAAYASWYAGWSAAAEKDRGTDARGVRWYTAGGTRHTEPSTIPYDPAEGITMPKTITTFLTLRAVAVVTDGSRAASDVVTISYQPPAPVQAVYASPVDGTAVEYGTTVTLSCATEDALIFYKVYDSQPADDDLPVANQDLGYTEPIPITKEVWIRAIAVRSNVESVVTTYHYTVAPKAASPATSLPSGSVVPKGMRIELSGQGTLVYTLDGSDPKAADSARLYGTTVNLDGDYGATVTVRAYVEQDGYTPSDTVSFVYTICKEENYLTISVNSGSVIANNTSVTLSTAVTNGRIFYTLDGSTPQITNVYSGGSGKNYTTYEWASASASTLEGSSFTLSGNPDTAVTVRAIAVANGGDGGQVQTFTYKFQTQAAPPTASIPTGAVVFDGAAVTLTAKEGTIYYTTDGSNPTTASAIYTNPINVSGAASTVLKAIAVVEGKAASTVAEFRYTRAGTVATPVFSIPSGEIDTGTTVTITTATEGAVIYYSTDGTEPTADNLKELTMYVAPISITRAVTIKAIAVSDKLDESAVQSATYTVRKPDPQPTPAPDSEPVQNTITDRLTSRRTYNSEEDGPTYSDVVLRETVCNTVLSAPEGIVPADAVLTVQQMDPTRSDEASVQSSLNQRIARIYEASLTLNGDPVTPGGQFELGFAIPAEYQNGIVTVSRINDDGTLTQFAARRSGGMAYIQTDSMGRFALSVPQTDEGAASPLRWVLGIGGALAVLLGLLLLLWYRRRRQQAEEATEEPADLNEQDYQNIHEFFVNSDDSSTE